MIMCATNTPLPASSHLPSKLSKELVYDGDENGGPNQTQTARHQETQPPLIEVSSSADSSRPSDLQSLHSSVSSSSTDSSVSSLSSTRSIPSASNPTVSRAKPHNGISPSTSNSTIATISGTSPRSGMARSALLQPPLRPGMQRYQSLPTISTLSPTRQHFRIPNDSPREIKETLDASLVQESVSGRTVINQYELLDVIGKGSLSAVHVGVDQQTKVMYAIKNFSKSQLRKRRRNEFLHKRKIMPGGRNRNASDFEQEWSQNSSPIELIRREVAIMKKLDHPNIVSLVEVLDDPYGDNLYVILEWCSKGVIANTDLQPGGPTNGKLFSRSPYTDDQCRLFLRDMILGIEYLHSQGIVHRDIKAENVLVSDDDVVKIVDFGVSEMFDRAQTNDLYLTNHAGSPAYMAPELVELMVKRDPRRHRHSSSEDVNLTNNISGKATDIWSMGVVLYYIRFGFLPFTADSISELCKKVLEDDVRFPDDASDELKFLLRGVLEKDPKKRLVMREIRENGWVTKDGEDHLLSEEENCAYDITPVTEEDLQQAIELIEGVMDPDEASERLRKLHGWRGSLASSARSSRASSPLGYGRSSSVGPENSQAGSVETADKTSLLRLTRALDEIISGQPVSPPNMRPVTHSPLISAVVLSDDLEEDDRPSRSIWTNADQIRSRSLESSDHRSDPNP